MLPCILQGQNLTNNKMAADFDQFVGIVDNYFRAKDVVEQRTQTNITDELKRLKDECNFISTDVEFADLIRKSLNILCDKHAAIANANLVKMYVSQFSEIANFGDITLTDTLNADYYYDSTYSGVMLKMKCGIRAKYIDGEYYNIRPFVYNGNIVASGEIISAFNGIPVSEFVAQNRYKLYNLSWDEKNSEWYSELFWLNKEVITNNKFSLTIGEKEVALDSRKTVDITEKFKQFSSTPIVTAFNIDILYIRLPVMSNSQWYIEQITKQFNSDIKKIIIDIRGNRGGQDKVWHEILSTLICDTVSVKTDISINDNEATKKILPLFKLDSFQIVNTAEIFPGPQSISFDGTIYIFQDSDTYSAASSLSSLAFQMENVVLVGQPLSHIGGRGLTPLIFRLNNSGIIFRMPFTLDLSGSKVNPYMNKVEIEINQNAEEYLDMLHENQYEIGYIENKDKMVEFVRKH